MKRRGFLGSLMAGPWVVRSGVLMPVKPAIALPSRELAKKGLFVLRYGQPGLLVEVVEFENPIVVSAGQDLVLRLTAGIW